MAYIETHKSKQIVPLLCSFIALSFHISSLSLVVHRLAASRLNHRPCRRISALRTTLNWRQSATLVSCAWTDLQPSSFIAGHYLVNAPAGRADIDALNVFIKGGRRDVYQWTQVRAGDRSRRTAIRARATPAASDGRHAQPRAGRRETDTHGPPRRPARFSRAKPLRHCARSRCSVRRRRRVQLHSVLGVS